MAKAPCKYDVPHRGLKWLQYYSAHNVYHPGWDLNSGVGNQDLGEEVVAPFSGVVHYIAPLGKRNGGFGNFIILEHPQLGKWSRFAHLDKVMNLRLGQKVKEGQKLGEVGNSGTTYAHLHWEVWNLNGYNMQKAHWKPFMYYPSAKNKLWVQDHYVDGLALIEELNKEKETAMKWCKKHLSEADLTGLKEPEASRLRELARKIISWTS
jgi:hypothetical protein